MYCRQKLSLTLWQLQKRRRDQLRVDVVLDNKAVFVGGIDMTSLVIAKLNSELE